MSLIRSDSGEKDAGDRIQTEEGGEGPLVGSLLEPDFLPTSRPSPLLLLTLLSVDTRTFCSCQARIPSFAPSPSSNQLPDTRLFCCSQSAASERGLYYPIPSPSFAMTSTFLCKSLNSWVTKILTFFLRVALAGEKSTEKHLKN